jgi:hypothetical protein
MFRRRGYIVGAKEESSLEDFRLLHLSCMSRGPTCDSRAWLSSVYFGMCRCVFKKVSYAHRSKLQKYP